MSLEDRFTLGLGIHANTYPNRSCNQFMLTLIPLFSLSKYTVSTGRGGAGNIRASSQSRARDDPDSGEEEARERSRERSKDRGHGSGRGGAGNFRSASKNPEDRLKESKIIEEDTVAEVGPSII